MTPAAVLTVFCIFFMLGTGLCVESNGQPENCEPMFIRHSSFDSNNLQSQLKNLSKQPINKISTPCFVLSLEGGHTEPYVLTDMTLLRVSVAIEAKGGPVHIQCKGKVQDNMCFDKSYLSVRPEGERPIPYFALRGNITFSDCELPFLISNVSIVEIEGVIFKGFTNGALQVLHSCAVSISDAIFFNNTYSPRNILHNWHNFTNGAGLLVYSRITKPVGNVSLSQHCGIATLHTTIRGCTFTENFAKYRSVTFCGQGSHSSHPFASGRGGGMAAIVNQTGFHLTVSHCTFDHNRASILGGGMYLLNYNPFSEFVYEDNVFRSNSVSPLKENDPDLKVRYAGGGGALFLGLTNSLLDFNHRNVCEYVTCNDERYSQAVIIRRNAFANNSGSFGGGILIEPSHYLNTTSILIESCNFTQNHVTDYGAAIAVVMLVSFPNVTNSGRNRIRNVILMNNLFKNNSALYGVVASHVITLEMEGVNTFSSNTGICLRVIAASCHISGRLEFLGNHVATKRRMEMPAAAVSLVSFGQLFLHSGAYVLFEGNSGFVGSSIIVDAFHSIPFLKINAFYSLCFISFHQHSVYSEFRRHNIPPQLNASVVFERNEAHLGPAIHAEGIGVCNGPRGQLLCDSTFQYRNNTSATCPAADTMINSTTSNNNSSRGNGTTCVSGKPSLFPSDIDNCPSNATFCDIVSGVLHLDLYAEDSERDELYPGEPFRVWMNPLDEACTPAGAIIRAKAEGEGSLMEPMYYVFPEYMNIQPNSDKQQHVSMAVGLSISTYKSLNLNDFKFNPISVTIKFTRRVLKDLQSMNDASISIKLKACSPGYNLTYNVVRKAYFCECQIDGQLVLDCQDGDIIMKGGVWGYNDSQGLLMSHICPVGYCGDRALNEVRTNECKLLTTIQYSRFSWRYPDKQCEGNRQGVLCGACKNGTGLTTLLDICSKCANASKAIIFFMVCAVFVTEITVLLLSMFLPLHYPHWLLPFLYYVQTASYAAISFGRYNVETVQYMAFLGSFMGLYYPFDLCLDPQGTAIQLYGMRFTPPLVLLFLAPLVLVPTYVCCRRRFTYSGVWTLFQLMLNPLLFTVFSSWNCVHLPGIGRLVWFRDGTVDCFKGWHALLFVVSLVMILAGGAFIAITSAVLLHPKRLSSLFQLLRDEASRPYRSEHSKWALVDWTRRIITILTIVMFPARPAITVFFVTVFFAVYSYFKPYRQRVVSCIESALMFNGIALLLSSSMKTNIDYRRWLAFLYYLPVPIVLFVVFLSYLWEPIKKAYAKYRNKINDTSPNILPMQRRTVTQSSLRAAPVSLLSNPTSSLLLHENRDVGSDDLELRQPLVWADEANSNACHDDGLQLTEFQDCTRHPGTAQ